MTAAAGRGTDAAQFTEPAPRSRSAATAAANAAVNPPASGVLGEVSNVISSARRVVSGMLDLAVLEGRRAGIALVWMLALGVAAGILGVTAWLGLMAVAALALMAAGLSPIWAVLLVVVLNLAVAGGAVFVCVKKSKDLMFTASRRQLARQRAGQAMNLQPPSDEEIRAAELRLQQAERDLSEGKKRAKAAVLDAAVHPLTLLGIAIAAGVIGYKLFKPPPVVPEDWRSRLTKWTRGLVPPRAPTQAETAATTAATTTGVMGILIALAMKYATRQLPGIGFRLFNEAMRKRGAYGARVPARPTATLH